VAVPTTAGTGSEATHFAGVYIDGERFSLAHEFVLPDVALVDARLTFSMPAAVAAATAMDALGQAVESYWCRNSTEASQQDARRAIRAIVDHAEDSVRRALPEARCAQAAAAQHAGRAINVTKTTAAHAVSYTMTTDYGVPHGHAVALTLGEFLIFNSRVREDDLNDPRGVDHVQRSVREVTSLLGASGPEEARDRLRALLERLGLRARLRDVGIGSAADLDRIAAGVNPARAANNPRRVTREAVREILERIA
jgi:alcohol dehydrogenase class IV